MASIIELLGVLLVSFILNIIPFAGPSNLFIASNAAILVPTASPLCIGLLVALGSTTAKLIHYIISFFVGNHLSEERKKRMDMAATKLRGWAFLAIFIAAATPIPDEPVIIPLGLMRYSITKFTLAFFTGKLVIAVLGAYAAGFGQQLLEGYLSQEALAIISVVLTITITVVVLKVDLPGVAEKIMKKLGLTKNGEHYEETFDQ